MAMPCPCRPCLAHTKPTLAPPLSSRAHLVSQLPLALLSTPALALGREEHDKAQTKPCPRRPGLPKCARPRRRVHTGVRQSAVSPRCSRPRLDPLFRPERHHHTRNTLVITLSPTVARRRRRRTQRPPRPRRCSHVPNKVRHRLASPLPPRGPPGRAEQRRALSYPASAL